MNIVPRDATLRRHVLYPDYYCWYILAGAVDIMLTYIILERFDGSEVNQIANHMIKLAGLWGLILLKFSTVIVVVLICEYVGRRRRRLGKAVAIWAIAMSALPVGIGLLQLGAWVFGAKAMMGQ